MPDLTAADFLPKPNFSRPTPDEMAQKIFEENPPEVRNIPSYTERQKDSVFDHIPTRQELRAGTFDLMHDTLGYSPRASRKTSEFLVGTTSGTDESAMPIPDIGAGDFITGAMARKLVDPLLMADAQQFRLDDEPGMSTLMAGLAVLPPAAYATKTAKLSGASDEVLEDTMSAVDFDPSRRGFLKDAGIATMTSQLPAPLLKAGKMVAETPGAAKAVGTAAKIAATGAMKIPSLLGMAKAAKFYGDNTFNYASDMDELKLTNMEWYDKNSANKISKILRDELKVADDEAIVSFNDPKSRFAEDFDKLVYDAAVDKWNNTLMNRPNIMFSGDQMDDITEHFAKEITDDVNSITSKKPLFTKTVKDVEFFGAVEDLNIDFIDTNGGRMAIIKDPDGATLFYKVKKADLE